MDGSTLEAGSFNQTTVDWRRPPPRVNPADAPPWPADAAAIEIFREDGATVLRGVFEEWVEPLRAGLERNLEAPQDYAFPCESAPDAEPGRFFDSYCNWLLIPEYLDHVTSSCAASMAGQLMRSRTEGLAELLPRWMACTRTDTDPAGQGTLRVGLQCDIDYPSITVEALTGTAGSVKVNTVRRLHHAPEHGASISRHDCVYVAFCGVWGTGTDKPE